MSLTIMLYYCKVFRFLFANFEKFWLENEVNKNKASYGGNPDLERNLKKKCEGGVSQLVLGANNKALFIECSNSLIIIFAQS